MISWARSPSSVHPAGIVVCVVDVLDVVVGGTVVAVVEVEAGTVVAGASDVDVVGASVVDEAWGSVELQAATMAAAAKTAAAARTLPPLTNTLRSP
jgi:hypothetical protein